MLEISPAGQVSENAGCNAIVGTARMSGSALSFGPIGRTKKLCTDAVMNQEQKFVAALEAMRGWSRDDQRRKLMLLDGDAKQVMLLARH